MSGETALEGPILGVLATEIDSISREIGSDRTAAIRLGLSNTTIGKARKGAAGIKVLRAVLKYRGLRTEEDLLRKHHIEVEPPPREPDERAAARLASSLIEEDDLPDYRNLVLVRRHFAEQNRNVPEHIYEAVREMRAYENKKHDLLPQWWIDSVEDMLRNYERAYIETRSAMMRRIGATDLVDDDDEPPRARRAKNN